MRRKCKALCMRGKGGFASGKWLSLLESVLIATFLLAPATGFLPFLPLIKCYFPSFYSPKLMMQPFVLYYCE